MTTNISPSTKTQNRSDASLVSHYELFLFCCAAFLLAVAYPTKQEVAPQAMPVSQPTILDQNIELEAMNTLPSEAANTTVLLEQISPELLSEIPAIDPAS